MFLHIHMVLVLSSILFSIHAAEPRVLREGQLGEYDYARHASVAIGRNNKIFIGASVHMAGEKNPLAKVYLWSSGNNGETWSQPKKLSDTPFDDIGGGLCVTCSGALLLNYSTSLGWAFGAESGKPDYLEWWNQIKNKTLVEANTNVNFWMRRSIDGGETWSAPYELPANPLSGVIQLSNGKLFMFGHRVTDSIRQMIGGERNNFILSSVVSDDDGVTWTKIKDLAGIYGAGVISSSVHETGFAENKQHQVVVIMRNDFDGDGTKLKQFEVLEGDGTKWSGTRTIGAAVSFHITALRNGMLFMSCIEKSAPTKLVSRISVDGGKTWRDAGIIVEGNGVIEPGFSSAELQDGALVTVWCEKNGNGSIQLRYRVWTR